LKELNVEMKFIENNSKNIIEKKDAARKIPKTTEKQKTPTPPAYFYLLI
jgi:hypothetical protein